MSLSLQRRGKTRSCRYSFTNRSPRSVVRNRCLGLPRLPSLETSDSSRLRSLSSLISAIVFSRLPFIFAVSSDTDNAVPLQYESIIAARSICNPFAACILFPKWELITGTYLSSTVKFASQSIWSLTMARDIATPCAKMSLGDTVHGGFYEPS